VLPGLMIQLLMARAIVRFSIDGEAGNETANRARAALELDSAFHRIGTGSYESHSSASQLLHRIEHLLQVLREMPGGGDLDHLWVYLDDSVQ
jgi:hypothetical protein